MDDIRDRLDEIITEIRQTMVALGVLDFEATWVADADEDVLVMRLKTGKVASTVRINKKLAVDYLQEDVALIVLRGWVEGALNKVRE